LFRSHYDQAFIPDEFQGEVVEQLADLCKRADREEHMSKCQGVLFNLKLRPEHALLALSYCMAGANLRTKDDSSSAFGLFPRIDNVPDQLSILAVAIAITILREWKRPLTPGFYSWVAFIDMRFPDVNTLPAEARDAVTAVFGEAYQRGATTYENPIERRKRLGAIAAPLAALSSVKMGQEILSMLPKRLRVPYRTG
jgi:hypothetical protein